LYLYFEDFDIERIRVVLDVELHGNPSSDSTSCSISDKCTVLRGGGTDLIPPG